MPQLSTKRKHLLNLEELRSTQILPQLKHLILPSFRLHFYFSSFKIWTTSTLYVNLPDKIFTCLLQYRIKHHVYLDVILDQYIEKKEVFFLCYAIPLTNKHKTSRHHFPCRTDLHVKVKGQINAGQCSSPVLEPTKASFKRSVGVRLFETLISNKALRHWRQTTKRMKR